MLDPAAYIRKAQSSYRAQQQITLEDVENQALVRCPNYRHSDGRIYASHRGEDYFAVTVSPLNPEFNTQIEPGIYPVVCALLEKNYLTVSSCEGHGGSHSFVKIAFGSEIIADRFIEYFRDMDYVTLIKKTTSANVIQYWEDGKPRWRSPLENEFIDRNLEVQDINFLFRRRYQQVCYVDLCLHLTQPGLTKIFRRYKIMKDQRKNKNRRIQDLVDRIQSLEPYEL